MSTAPKKRKAPKLRHHSRFMVLPADFPPAPWSVYDPNGDYETRNFPRGRAGYRPVWIRDANNNDVFYLGSGARFMRLAAHLVRLYNMETLKGKS